MTRPAASAKLARTGTAVRSTDPVDRFVPPNEVDEVVQEIGPRIRALRAGLGLSLQQMSAIAEVSAASIHKIERGEMVPTITTLLKLAAAFRRPISYLINEQPGDPNDTWHTKRGDGESVETVNGNSGVRISGPTVRFRGEATITTIPAGGTDSGGAPRAGEGLVYVLGGGLNAKIGDRDFVLRKGDSLHYLTDRTATWSNGGKTSAEVLRISFPTP